MVPTLAHAIYRKKHIEPKTQPQMKNLQPLSKDGPPLFKGSKNKQGIRK